MSEKKVDLAELVKISSSEFLKHGVTLQNQYDTISFKGFIPAQANTNIDENTDEVGWGQLLCHFKTSYGRTSQTQGEVVNDNATLKTLKVSFPAKYLKDHNITSDDFKDFFDTYIVGKLRLLIPVSDERQSFKGKTPMPNQTEVTVHPSFDLHMFIQNTKQANGVK